MNITEEIRTGIDNPHQMEQLYRADPSEFEKRFDELYAELGGCPGTEFWFNRLHFNPDELTDGAGAAKTGDVNGNLTGKYRLIFTIFASLLAGTLIKFPDMLHLHSDIYLQSNMAFFVLPLLVFYYAKLNKIDIRKSVFIAGVIVISTAFINLLPWAGKSDTRILSAIHFVFLMWLLLGLAYTGFDYKNTVKKLDYLKRNSDLLILTIVILAAGGVLTALTIGMFSVIKVNIEKFYFEYIAVYGAAASTIVANYMLETSPALVKKVTPFLSRIFLPLILVMMSAFLVALLFFARDPFNNRDELIVFNLLLGVILAIIFFSFSGQSNIPGPFYDKVIFLLSAEAVIINTVALSAIVYRLFIFGISPNRLAVLGSNVLMFVNLIIICFSLFKYIRTRSDSYAVNNSITVLMPYYAVWILAVSFVFPIVFGFV